MPRMKQTPRSHHAASYVMKKVKKAAAKMKQITSGSKGLVSAGGVVLPFKAAGGGGLKNLQRDKEGLLKQLKRRWKSGTVAKREIRKLTRSTNLLLAKLPFERLAREIAQFFSSDIRFTPGALHALHQSSEAFLNEFLHNADLAKCHAKRDTLMEEDLRFARFMTPESMWVTPDRIHQKETFVTYPEMRMDKGRLPKHKGSGADKVPAKKPSTDQAKKSKPGRKKSVTVTVIVPGASSETSKKVPDGTAPPEKNEKHGGSKEDVESGSEGTGSDQEEEEEDEEEDEDDQEEDEGGVVAPTSDKKEVREE